MWFENSATVDVCQYGRQVTSSWRKVVHIYAKQEGISVECQPPAFWHVMLYSEQIWTFRGAGCTVRFENVWGGVPRSVPCTVREEQGCGPVRGWAGLWSCAGVGRTGTLYRERPLLWIKLQDATENILNFRWLTVIRASRILHVVYVAISRGHCFTLHVGQLCTS